MGMENQKVSPTPTLLPGETAAKGFLKFVIRGGK